MRREFPLKIQIVIIVRLKKHVRQGFGFILLSAMYQKPVFFFLYDISTLYSAKYPTK